MNWLLYAIISQLLWAIVAHFDKQILSKMFKGQVGSVMLVSTFFMLIFIPIIYVFYPAVLQADSKQIIFGSMSGFLYMLSVLFYFYALRDSKPTVTSILWLMSGPIAYFLGYIFFDELLSFKQIFGALIIFLSGVVAVMQKEENGFSLKPKIFIYMIFATALFALSGVTFKFSSTEDFWITFFYDFVGAFIFGLILFVFVKKYRMEFLHIFSQNKLKVLILNGSNELISGVAGLLSRAAVTIGPLALVYFTNALNPIFVFIIGVILTILVPKIYKEDLSRENLILKVSAIIIAIIGILLLEI